MRHLSVKLIDSYSGTNWWLFQQDRAGIFVLHDDELNQLMDQVEAQRPKVNKTLLMGTPNEDI